MMAMACRTMIINPTDEQKEAYNLVVEAHEHLVKSLVPGKKICDIYNSTLQLVEQKDSKLAASLFQHFGFGIGYTHKEDIL